jgi:sugar lactone lactonase YvrE
MIRSALLLTALFYSTITFGQTIRELYQQGLKAYDEKNYQTFLEKMNSIDSMRPNYPPVVYNMAAGYALTNNVDQSIESLRKFIQMDATKNFAADSDFVSLLDHPKFERVKKEQELASMEMPTKEAFNVSIKNSHPESITYSKKLKSYLIGGVRDGKIWKVTEGEDPTIWAESPDNSWAIMGLDISPNEKILWVCTSAMNNYEGLTEEDNGKVCVLKYDLKKGTLLETFVLPPNHVFGDLITDSKGNVYISDGTANQLYWISEENGKLELFADLNETLFNLQGLTLNKDETAIYLSDYIDGIYRITIQNKQLEKVETKGVIKGIDGLYFINNALIGLINGTNPNRIVRYVLDEKGMKIIRHETRTQGGILGEPTQGCFVDDNFYFIANSPWGAYDREGNFTTDEETIVIGILNKSDLGDL